MYLNPSSNTFWADINFDYKFIKQIEGNDNTLVSPLSMAYLLSMIQSGAKGNTLNELNIALDNYDLQPMENIDGLGYLRNME